MWSKSIEILNPYEEILNDGTEQTEEDGNQQDPE